MYVEITQKYSTVLRTTKFNDLSYELVPDSYDANSRQTKNKLCSTLFKQVQLWTEQ